MRHYSTEGQMGVKVKKSSTKGQVRGQGHPVEQVEMVRMLMWMIEGQVKGHGRDQGHPVGMVMMTRSSSLDLGHVVPLLAVAGNP